jgi:enoyl-CoA hydratase/carnithine racemase
MEYKEILFKVEKGVAVATLNRPDIRNAISGTDIIEEIESVCRCVNQNQTVKVLIITATDPAFSSGGNIKDMATKTGMFEGTPAEVMENYRRNIQRIPMAIHGIEVPTIAAVNGPAIGAGCDLALMCDMRIASDKATFGESFINVGLIPGDGGAFFLPKVVGMAKACEMTFTGDIVDAEESFRIGLVNWFVPHDQLMPAALELAHKISEKPAAALRMTKRLLYMGRQMPLKELLEQSAAFQALCHHSEDHFEALSAIFEKRKPDFKGR